jgi:hypothetical protein
MMVKRYPNFKKEVGGSIPGCEISALLNRKLAMWSTALVLWRWPIGHLSFKIK